MNGWMEGGRNRERFKGGGERSGADYTGSHQSFRQKRRERTGMRNPTVDGWCSQENPPTNFVDILSF